MDTTFKLTRARQVALVDQATGVARLSRTGKKRFRPVMKRYAIPASSIRFLRDVDHLFALELQMLQEICAEEMAKEIDSEQRKADQAAVRRIDEDWKRFLRLR